MREYILTKEAEVLLRALYREYKKERKKGASRSNAALLGGSEHIQKTILPDWSIADVDDACFELVQEGLIEILPGDNTVLMTSLKPEAIAYMQSRVKRSFGSVASAAKDLLDLIP